MRILILQSAKLGDMVCTTPMFRSVKERYPDAHLIVVGREINKEVLLGNPHIDEYVVHPKTNADLRALLHEKRPDYLLLTSPNPSALLMGLLARVRHIVTPQIMDGVSPYATKTYRLLSLFAKRVPHHMGSYAPREYLRLLEPLGITTDDTRKEVYVAPEAVARTAQLFKEAGYNRERDLLIGISPGAGNKIKVWGADRFARVAESLQKSHGAKIIVFGGKADREEARLMINALADRGSVLNLVEKLSLEELKAAISFLNVFIAVDTGPIYIAEAFGIPTVDIVGPMDEREQPPRGPRHRVVVAPRTSPALHIMSASVYDREEARRQTEAITTDMVLKEAEALLS